VNKNFAEISTLPCELPRGRFLYDADCDFCERWAKRFKPILHHRGISVETLQATWDAGNVDMPASEWVQEVRFLSAENRMYSGAQAYLFMFREIWWLWLTGAIFSFPGFYSVFRRVYNTLKARRTCKGVCNFTINPKQS
jgi:predicted DCC family thiol-disulfide oxidoreductase YuxK